MNWLFRLLIALVCGAILGMDRELRERRIGVRTYMLVSLGSAAFTILAIEMVGAAGTGDATRAIQGIAGGIGFLGAGAIIQGDQKVGGMATAASLWASGAIGVAAGAGYAFLAVGVAVFAALILAVSKFLENRGAEDRPDLE